MNWRLFLALVALLMGTVLVAQHMLLGLVILVTFEAVVLCLSVKRAAQKDLDWLAIAAAATLSWAFFGSAAYLRTQHFNEDILLMAAFLCLRGLLWPQETANKALGDRHVLITYASPLAALFLFAAPANIYVALALAIVSVVAAALGRGKSAWILALAALSVLNPSNQPLLLWAGACLALGQVLGRTSAPLLAFGTLGFVFGESSDLGIATVGLVGLSYGLGFFSVPWQQQEWKTSKSLGAIALSWIAWGALIYFYFVGPGKIDFNHVPEPQDFAGLGAAFLGMMIGHFVRPKARLTLDTAWRKWMEFQLREKEWQEPGANVRGVVFSDREWAPAEERQSQWLFVGLAICFIGVLFYVGW